SSRKKSGARVTRAPRCPRSWANALQAITKIKKNVTVETITLRRGIRSLLVVQCRTRASINEIPERCGKKGQRGKGAKGQRGKGKERNQDSILILALRFRISESSILSTSAWSASTA